MFARELRIIAEPRRPVPTALAEVDLVELTAATLAPERLAARGFAAELQREGAIVGRYDGGHLGVVLGELLSNAVKYRGDQPVIVRLDVARTRARLVVENAGRWSGPASRPARFVRGESRARVPGFGVGLWLVARLLRAQSGKVHYACESRRTRAVVSLPFVRATAAAGLTIVLRPLDRGARGVAGR